ncbi:enoyl-CoA hydratase/isomerase family protein [Diplonema papillatum]|nr:enoyl-CoA hydratase/isomerase family protein [Diplonema papillatum]
MGYPTRRVEVSLTNGVARIRFNNPRKLNAWDPVMLDEVRESLRIASLDAEVKVVMLTGTGDYYCAGVDFASNLQPMRPSVLQKLVEEGNRELFAMFIEFPKPIVVAVNGPAIGACVTSAVLCDRIVAADRATFSTPFAQLKVSPEGCSTYLFPLRMGEANAQRMLGEEGWKCTAREAKAAGFVHEVVPVDELWDRAQAVAESLIKSNYVRAFVADPEFKRKCQEVNREESRAVAQAFFAPPFLLNQETFFWSKKKYTLYLLFKMLRWTRPIWSRL